MKVNIERHTLEISKLLSRIRQLEEGIKNLITKECTCEFCTELQKLLEEST